MHFSAAPPPTLVAAVLAEGPVDASCQAKTSHGNLELEFVTDQGDRWKINFGSIDCSPDACSGHLICCTPRIPGAGDGDADKVAYMETQRHLVRRSQCLCRRG